MFLFFVTFTDGTWLVPLAFEDFYGIYGGFYQAVWYRGWDFSLRHSRRAACDCIYPRIKNRYDLKKKKNSWQCPVSRPVFSSLLRKVHFFPKISLTFIKLQYDSIANLTLPVQIPSLPS